MPTSSWACFRGPMTLSTRPGEALTRKCRAPYFYSSRDSRGRIIFSLKPRSRATGRQRPTPGQSRRSRRNSLEASNLGSVKGQLLRTRTGLMVIPGPCCSYTHSRKKVRHRGGGPPRLRGARRPDGRTEFLESVLRRSITINNRPILEGGPWQHQLPSQRPICISSRAPAFTSPIPTSIQIFLFEETTLSVRVG